MCGPTTDALPDRLIDWIHSDPVRRLNARAIAYAESLGDRRLRTRDLWSGPLEALLIDRWACRAVARVWPQRFMRIVNALVPALAHAAVEAARPLTAPQLADLMATSSAVYTPDGQPTGAAGLFALMEAAEDLITNAAPDDLQDTLEPIARALYARSDAVWSARAWLQRSISMGTS